MALAQLEPADYVFHDLRHKLDYGHHLYSYDLVHGVPEMRTAICVGRTIMEYKLRSLFQLSLAIVQARKLRRLERQTK